MTGSDAAREKLYDLEKGLAFYDRQGLEDVCKQLIHILRNHLSELEKLSK
jgi:hypothetical protein